MDKRLAFDEDAETYEKWRPRYVSGMFADIIRYANLAADSRTIEVGIGTGQVTGPFLKTGCGVTAIELGKNLAEFTAKKFASYPNFKIVNQPFEDYSCANQEVDLLYSATAFYWIPEEIGHKKAFDLLKSGGTLALFWNRPFVGRVDDPLHQAIQKVYIAYWPTSAKKPKELDQERYDRIQRSIVSAGFVQYELKLYSSERHFRADEYVELLRTYSDHRSLTTEVRLAFEAELKKTIATHGNELAVYDTIDLHLARKL